MSKSIRVRTTPNGDDKYIKVELKQDFDLLEILSLKLKQEEVYQNFCSNYGVVAGRISVNNGFGLPNAKVSIFIPITAEDSQDEIIRTLYPYESPQPQDKNEQGIRYNLLPNQQQSFDHTPVGTFPTKLEILDNNTTLGIHEKYYKYTTTTNEAGDFILFGIPVGDQLLHYDIDWSDVGFLSLRPYDLIERGFNKNLFLSPFKFSSSPNLDNLPQLVGQNTNITVEPFWCDDLSAGRVVGITRKDIAITTMDLTPSATFFGSVFSDDEKDSINKNCNPRRKTGRLGEVITTSGKLEAIRRTVEGSIEKYDIPEDALDENGNYALQLPMNIRKVVTDEFGNLIPSPDGVSGIATEGDYRFRISIDRTDNDNRKRQRGKFLVPNMTSNYNFGEYESGSAPFNINEQLSTATASSPVYSGDTSNQYNYLEDFFSFRWKKVYTTRQFIGRYQKSKSDGKRKFTGIKDIEDAEGVNKFPSNRIDAGVHPLYSFFCILLTLLGMIYAIVNWIIVVINSIITLLCNIKIPVGVCVEVTGCSSCAKKMKCKRNLLIGTTSEKMRGCCATGSVADPEDCKEAWISGESQAIGNATYPSYGYMVQATNGWPCTNQPGTQPYGPTYPITDAGCVQMATDQGLTDYADYYLDTSVTGDEYETQSCDVPCDEGVKIKIGAFCKCLKIELKGKCVFGQTFCKKCKSLCPGKELHSCCQCHCYGCSEDDPYFCVEDCNDAECSGGEPNNDCCSDCCIKIPLIELTCAENSEFAGITPFVIGTPFARKVCNAQLIRGYCRDCSGLGIPFISPWIGCKLEGIAGWLGMLKFDFYNDWINGSLYFPLIKRKNKVKNRGKRAGQIKYDKFCDYDCNKDAGWVSGGGFQNVTTSKYRVTVSNSSPSAQSAKIKKCAGVNCGVVTNGQWCEITLPGGYSESSEWFEGSLEDNSAPSWYGGWKYAKRQAYRTLSLQGTSPTGDDCTVNFNKWYSANNSPNTPNSDWDSFIQNSLLSLTESDYIISGDHGKPYYTEVEDPITGIRYQKNVGGHGHHKNKCNGVYRTERLEYWQDNGSCQGVTYDENGELSGTGVGTGEVEDEGDEIGGTACATEDQSNQCAIGNCTWGTCRCSREKDHSDGTTKRPCCNCDPRHNEKGILHGIIKELDGVIYYASINPKPTASPSNTFYNIDDTHNPVKIQYKSNLLFPTNICEVGSSVFCDIDEVPFILDQIPPTTFSISEESEKFKKPGNNSNAGGSGTEQSPYLLETSDRNSSKINLSAYVSFGCGGVKCMNTQATVNQSQIGVDTIDKTDLDMEIGTCKMYFDHDEELREYFCRRFSGYKNQDLDVHYQRPGSTQYDNVYNTYPEVTPTGGTHWYQIDGDPALQGLINDADSIIPGDRCGIQYTSYEYNTSINGVNYGTPVPDQIGDIDYFYGVAPSVTNADGAFTPVFPTYNGTSTYGQGGYNQTTSPSINIQSAANGGQEEKGINFGTSQTPYYFYFGIVPGKTALHKVVSKYFADKIDKTTLGKLSGERRNNQSNFKNIVKNPLTLYKTCLGESINSTS